MDLVEKILEDFQEEVSNYGWVMDGSELWEQLERTDKSYIEAKYDIFFALLSSIREAVRGRGHKINFVIDPMPPDDNDVEFVVFEGNRVIDHKFTQVWPLSPENYRFYIEGILQILGITE